MDGSGGELTTGVWPADATRLGAAWRGARETPLLPTFVLCITFLGFGALTNEVGLTWLDTLFMSAFIFALPGQVVLVDEMARGASVLTAAIAVTATGVRLLPMTVSLLPMVRDRDGPKWLEYAVAFYVAVTVWVETNRRAPGVPRHLRAAYALGIAGWLVSASCIGAMVGFLAAAEVPAIVAAALLMTTPLYFLLAMLTSARSAESLMPIVLGLVLGPVFHLVAPNFDLVLTGLTGGTISFLVMRYGLKRGGRK